MLTEFYLYALAGVGEGINNIELNFLLFNNITRALLEWEIY